MPGSTGTPRPGLEWTERRSESSGPAEGSSTTVGVTRSALVPPRVVPVPVHASLLERGLLAGSGRELGKHLVSGDAGRRDCAAGQRGPWATTSPFTKRRRCPARVHCGDGTLPGCGAPRGCFNEPDANLVELFGDTVHIGVGNRRIHPRTLNQRVYINVFAITTWCLALGPPGNLFGGGHGVGGALRNEVKRIIISRPPWRP